MKKRTMVICAAIAVIGFTAFGFINKQQITEAIGMDSKAVIPAHSDAAIKVSSINFSEMSMAQDNDNLWYTVRGKYARSITKEKLTKAQLISDIISGYPTNWISEYVSVEVTSSHDGKEVKAIGLNDVLNDEQKNIFSSADLSAELNIVVKYKIRNSVTNNLDAEEMKISMTVVPEMEAEYIDGYDAMISYLKENSLDKLSEKNIKLDQALVVKFIVNEEGGIDDIKLAETSGDKEIDQLLIELIDKMPKWKPAENSMGEKVKQPFEFAVGPPGC